MAMAGAALVEAFERCTLPAQDFHHAQHVEVAWWYLRAEPAPRALARFAEALKRFAAANDAAQRYHETITWAFVFLINERMERLGREATWEQFIASNLDVLEKRCLLRYYREETLASELARRVFLLPDRL